MACCAAGKKAGVNGADKCDDCRSWEEQLYWKRFQPLHFFQILRPGSDFLNQIGIPRKFAQNAKPLLPAKVTLRGPSGASWSATLTKMGDDLFICDGWEEFVKAYALQSNSALIFKYDGISAFDILIFDGENLCEKESAYFVKKCAHAEASTEPQTGQRKRVASEAEIIDNEDTIQKSTKQARKEDAKTPVAETPKNLDSTNSNRNSRRKKPASRKRVTPASGKQVSSEADTRERTPIHTSENLCDSFAMLAELGKTIVQNATSYLEPENTTELNGPESRKGNKTPKVNGSFSPADPSQNTPQMNGSFGTTASDRSKKFASRKSLNETSLQNGSSSKGKQKKASASGGKQKSSKKKAAIKAVPLNMQPGDTEGVDISPFAGSSDRPKRNFVSDEGKIAVEMAKRHISDMNMSDRSFLLVLRPTNVYKRFMVTVPPAWFKKHLPPKSQNVCLRIEDKTWTTKLGFSPIKATGQICSGWKQFVHDNHLEEFDVCVFNFVSQNDTEALVDVSIFRAAPAAVTPLRQLIDDTPMLIIE